MRNNRVNCFGRISIVLCERWSSSHPVSAIWLTARLTALEAQPVCVGGMEVFFVLSYCTVRIVFTELWRLYIQQLKIENVVGFQKDK